MSTLRVNNIDNLGLDDVITNGVVEKRALPSGSVLQVVSVTKTDTFTTSSTSFTDVTGLTANITPRSTSSKIMIFAVVNGSGDVGTANAAFQLVRDASAISIGDAAGSRTRSSGMVTVIGTSDQVDSQSVNYLDSPNTTSTVTYKIQGRTLAAGTLFINRSDADTDNANHTRTVSSITLMEIAG